MLKDIRLHLDPDEVTQQALEADHASSIQQRYETNLKAFSANIPNLAVQLNQLSAQNISVFCNRDGAANLVDFGTGRTLYGLHPFDEVQQHVRNWIAHPLYIDLTSASGEVDDGLNLQASLDAISTRPALAQNAGTLVVLGLGAGYQLTPLLKQAQWRHIIIYEPELQYFKGSALMADWGEIFALAQQSQTTLFLLTGQDGRDLVANIAELQQHDTCSGFYLYKHYNHPVFDALELDLRQRSWQQITETGLRLNMALSGRDYKPYWTMSVEPHNMPVVKTDQHPLLVKNLAAFQRYFPTIYQQFCAYSPSYWHPVNQQNSINLLDPTDGALLYQQPKNDGLLNKQNFVSHPNKDGLVLGYTGTKLKDYLHYRYVAKTEQMLDNLHEAQGKLPENIKSLIMFGLGCGYQLEALLQDHQIDKLFVCEPNRDFFYASLFAIDWAAIIEDVDKQDKRLYINVGDDGQNLFRDLLQQFYAIGPYNLANTYFYQSYHNPQLEHAVANLREQLQVVISMGEYFDHARYGIAHTREMLNRGTHCLVSRKLRPIPYDTAEVPVFVVGNGPSLDASIEMLKEWRQQIIVISCGTALMPLYKAGITPDFHAEIEQNRSTFDWCSRVGDFDFLKQITLISCNGIHPDTCELFKDTLIAFKEGESSTASATEVLGKGNFTELQFAFPTVSNLVINLACEVGFTQLYLVGVDLGFVDVKHHHSKQSGYYNDDGEELYDYQEKNNTAIRTPGNFRPFVNTKHEFKVSKTIIEQALAKHPSVECFNTSDGAKVAGSTPLNSDFVLITSSPEQQNAALHFIRHKAFQAVDNFQKFKQRFDQRFVPDVLDQEFTDLQNLVRNTKPNVQDIEALIESQKTMLFDSYQTGRSLLFYLFYGSMNYTNAFLSKVIACSDSETELQTALDIWLEALDTISSDYQHNPWGLDLASSFAHLRKGKFLHSQPNTHHVEVIPHALSGTVLDKMLQHTKQTAPITSKRERVVLLDELNDNLDRAHPLVDRAILIKIGGSLSQLMSHPLHDKAGATSFYWYSWQDQRLPMHSPDVAAGRSPVFNPQQAPGFLSFLRKNFDSPMLYLPKLVFVEHEDGVMVGADKFVPILEQLDWVHDFYDYDFYVAIPLSGTTDEDVGYDARGIRGKRYQRHLLHSDLIFSYPLSVFTELYGSSSP